MDFSEAELEKFSLRNGDILICEGGEVGRSAIWREQLEKCSFQKALHRVRPNNDFATPEYVQEYMYEMHNRGGFRHLTSVATIAHLTAVKLKTLKMPLPPVEIQRQI